MRPRTALLVAAAMALPAAAQAPAPFSVEEASIAELQAAMAAGRVTSRRLVELYLARIEALDRRGPTLRSVLEINPDALAIAAALDDERKAHAVRSPLHGIPILIKDNLDTADRMTTTAGSLALEGSRPARDAEVVRRLRAAGAVILGKTNLSEWANFRSSKSTSGWSARGGQVRNPYALDRSPCGSSSGTGAAVAASLAAAGVGTETDGSIVCPSSVQALVGVKPTLGLVSQQGIVPIAHSQDTAGPMARTVADAAALLEIMVPGVDYSGAAGAQANESVVGLRIGVARAKFFGFNEATDRLAEAAIAALKNEGAVIVDPADLPHAGTYDDAELEVLLYEFKHDLDAYLGALGPSAPVKSLADVIAFNEGHRDRELLLFGQDLFLKAQKKGPLTEPAYRRALARARRLAGPQGIEAVLRKHRLVALVAPTSGPAWLIDPINGDHYVGGSSTPAAVAGTPAITVPMGFAQGLPVGLTFMGRARSEGILLNLAYVFERATRHRKIGRAHV